MTPRFPFWKTLAVGTAAVVGAAILGTVGCSNSSTPGPTPSPLPSASGTTAPSPSPIPSPVNFVVLNYPSIPPTLDPTYGAVDGYGQTATVPVVSPAPIVSSSIVTVHCNQTIAFYNVDRVGFHTASLLGPASGMNWPATFNNVNGANTASPMNTAIDTPEFSTGTLNVFSGAFGTSRVYTTGTTAGAFYFGDFYEYKPVQPGWPQMRTVINILCP